jgi:outer membrane lipoprotein carrier protein
MNKSLLVSLFVLFTLNVFAQQPDTKTAQTILNGVSEKYKSYSSVKADFSLKVENSANQATDNQTGTLYVKGNKFKLELNNQQIVCDNVTIWTFLKDANELQINNYEPDENSISPSQIFTIYEKNFLYGFIEEKTVNGKVFQVIELTPKDKTKSYFKIRLMINKTDKMVSQAKVFDKNGNKYTYEIQKFTPNVQLADNFFTFDSKKYPGIEVVDLR